MVGSTKEVLMFKICSSQKDERDCNETHLTAYYYKTENHSLLLICMLEKYNGSLSKHSHNAV